MLRSVLLSLEKTITEYISKYSSGAGLKLSHFDPILYLYHQGGMVK